MPLDPVEFSQKLIRHPSITPREEGVLDTLEEALKALGFQVQRKIFEEAGTDPVENLYARLGGEEPNFCFAGHLDVVPVGDFAAWTVDPFAAEIRGGYLYGRGAEDMKGAVGCFVAAVSRLLEQKEPLQGSVSLLITMDEEGPAINGTLKMLSWLRERGEKLSMCLVGEPTNPEALGEMIKIGRRGSMNCVLKVLGQQGHAAYPQFARNPVAEMVSILQILQHTPIDEGTDYFQPSNLEVTSIDTGNTAHNVIPASCEAKFNVRFNDDRPVARIKEWIQAVCDEHAEMYELDMQVTGEAFHTEPGPVTEMLQQIIERQTGLKPELSTTGGTSDARFIKDYCPVIEFGTTGRTAHQVDENVALETLHRLEEIYYELLQYCLAVRDN